MSLLSVNPVPPVAIQPAIPMQASETAGSLAFSAETAGSVASSGSFGSSGGGFSSVA